MKPNKSRSMYGTAFLLALPFVFTISVGASADPGTTQQRNADALRVAVGDTVAQARTWDWITNPDFYRPDGLSDYSEDFSSN